VSDKVSSKAALRLFPTTQGLCLGCNAGIDFKRVHKTIDVKRKDILLDKLSSEGKIVTGHLHFIKVEISKHTEHLSLYA
jgi:hypothetical protein